MNFMQAVESGFRHYVNGGGRAARSEYWYWTLFAMIVAIISAAADMTMFPTNEWGGPVGTVTGIALFLPGLAVSIRRLHDIDRSGYWVLLAFTIIGIPWLIYWACISGTEGDNDFGPDPLAAPVPA